MKFFFDNNLSPKLAKSLNELDSDCKVTHLREKYICNIDDLDWISALADEGGWIIISGDIRITKNKHEREAWLASGMTAFFLNKTWRHQKFWDITWRFIKWYPAMKAQAQKAHTGSGFIVPFGTSVGKFKQL